MHYHSKFIFMDVECTWLFFYVFIRELIKCKMCDALFFNKRAYENHNLFHKSDDVYIENEQQRYKTLHNFHKKIAPT
jgi:hypothetical protein